MTKELNRREFMRVPVYLEAEIDTGQPDFLAGITRDISVTGAFISCSGKLPVNSPCKVTLHFGETSKSPSIEMESEVVRVERTGMVFKFCNVKQEAEKRLRVFLERLLCLPERNLD